MWCLVLSLQAWIALLEGNDQRAGIICKLCFTFPDANRGTVGKVKYRSKVLKPTTSLLSGGSTNHTHPPYTTPNNLPTWKYYTRCRMLDLGE